MRLGRRYTRCVQSPEEASILDVALSAARAAGDVLRRAFHRPHTLHSKADASIVTEADLESEQTIRSLIAKRFPDHAILAEESGRTENTSRFTWVIDPLDGTKNFVRHVPLFSIEIAVLRDGVPIVGVSYVPLMEDLLWAIRGNGAFSNHRPIHVSATERLDGAYVSYGNLKHFVRFCKLGGLTALLEKAFQCRGIGDSWSFHLLAQGNIDVFADAWTAFWDVAALSVIVEEAGGIVTDIEGHPLTEDSRSVLASNSCLHPEALRYLRCGQF